MMGAGFQTWYKYIFLSAVDASSWAYWSALQKREWKDKETIMGKHLLQQIFLDCPKWVWCVHLFMSPPTNVEFAYSIPLESILFHYRFRISVGRRSIIASRKCGWSPREWEAVVVLVQSAVLTEWQEKPWDRQFAGLWGGHRHLRKDEDKRSHWAQESRLAFLCVFFFS